MSPEQMQAGRELDAAIAEKVMGWRWMRYVGPGLLPHDPRPRNLVPPVSVHPEDWAELQGDEVDLSPSDSALPAYSVDISSAWEVVEKLVADGRMVHVNNYGHGDWFAQVGLLPPFPDDRRLFDVHASTAPLAICRAALSAVAAKTSEVREVG